jgi:hypothetical protein
MVLEQFIKRGVRTSGCVSRVLRRHIEIVFVWFIWANKQHKLLLFKVGVVVLMVVVAVMLVMLVVVLNEIILLCQNAHNPSQHSTTARERCAW